MNVVKILGLVLSLVCAVVAKERLVVLDPASVEIIYELGSGEEIVAIAHLQQSQIAPVEKTSKLASVGSFSNPSIEKIVALKPTLVIVSSYSLGLQDRLKQLNIKTLYLEANRLNDLQKNITELAKILHKEQAGEELKARVEKELAALSQNPLNKSAVFLFSSNPLMGFADNSVIADILRVIGVKNLTPESQVARPIISSEFILKAKPDMLILGIEARDSKTLLEQNPALQNLDAAKNNQIFFYPQTHSLMRVSPSIVEKIKSLRCFLENSCPANAPSARHTQAH